MLAAIVGCCSQALSAQPANPAGMVVQADAAPENVQVAISRLPADTETIVVSKGPFGLTAIAPTTETKDNPISDKELIADFEDLSLGQFLFKDGLLAKRLEKKTGNFAVEGSRHLWRERDRQQLESFQLWPWANRRRHPKH